MATLQPKSGQVVTWFMTTHGRGNNGSIQQWATKVIDYDVNTDRANGADVIAQEVIKDSINKEVIKAGPMPMMPYYWPIEQQGVICPNGFGYEDPAPTLPVTKALLNAQPHTFIRRTSFTQQVKDHFHIAMPWPGNTIQDVLETVGSTDTNDPYNEKSPGFTQIAYANFSEGTEHSAWFLNIDGQPTSVCIEHRKLLSDGSEDSALTPYWRPEDIWNEILMPRIKMNMPIKHFSIDRISDDPVLWGYNKAGYILNSRYIQFASYLLPIEPTYTMELNGNITSWSQPGLTAPIGPGVIGKYWQLWPGFLIANWGFLLKYWADNSLDLPTELGPYIPYGSANILTAAAIAYLPIIDYTQPI